MNRRSLNRRWWKHALAAGLAVALLSGMRPDGHAKIEKLVEAHGLEQAGIVLIDLDRGRAFRHNPALQFDPGALIRWPLLAGVYAKVEPERAAREAAIARDLERFEEVTPALPKDVSAALGADERSLPRLLAWAGPESVSRHWPQALTPFDAGGGVTAEEVAGLLARAARGELVSPQADGAVLSALSGLREKAAHLAQVFEVDGRQYALAILMPRDPAAGRRAEALAAALREHLPLVPTRAMPKPGVKRVASAHHGSRKGMAIDAIVLHHTVIGRSAEDVAHFFRRKPIEASAHYIVNRDGTIVQAVDDARAAWHAGPSRFAGREGVNEFSIGIEIVNRGDGLDPYPPAQYRALGRLVAYLMSEYGISWERITGHKDVAVPRGRKVDPSDNFSYAALREAVARAQREHAAEQGR